MSLRDERFEYAVVLHKLVMAFDTADWDGPNPYPGLSEEAWALLHRDYGGRPLPMDDRSLGEEEDRRAD